MNDAPSETVANDDLLNPNNYRAIYPKALLDALASELGIDSEEARSRFEDTVLFEAGIYRATKNAQRHEVPRHSETKALEKVARKADGLSQAILETRQTGMAYLRLVAAGIPAA